MTAGSFHDSSCGDLEADITAWLKKLNFILWIKVRMPLVLGLRELRLTLCQTAQQPLHLSALNSTTRHIPPHTNIPSVDFINVLTQPSYFWMTVTPAHIPLVILSSTQSVLIKFPTSLDFLNFVKELRMLDEKTGVVGPSTWDVVDMLEPVLTHNCGDYFTVIVYRRVSHGRRHALCFMLTTDFPAWQTPKVLLPKAHDEWRNLLVRLAPSPQAPPQALRGKLPPHHISSLVPHILALGCGGS